MILNIFNGDCAYDAWKKSGESSFSLVWRENYLEGRIPGPDVPLVEFERIRAEELYKLMPELDFEKLLLYLRKMDRTVLDLSEDDSVRLWFDACMYDQMMLSRILFLLNGTSSSVFLFCEDVVLGNSPDLFPAKKESLPRLDQNSIQLYASAWEAFAGGKEALKCFLTEKRAECIPFLTKALKRYLEEYPDASGLGRTERQLLEIIRAGKSAPADIFSSLFSYEEFPFMGDSMCWRCLEVLEKKGFISIESNGNNKSYRLR